jgi:hypothetical protein
MGVSLAVVSFILLLSISPAALARGVISRAHLVIFYEQNAMTEQSKIAALAS